MKTWQEKQRDAARLAEAERIAEEEERERLEFAIEAEQGIFCCAADAIHSALIEHNGLFWPWLQDAKDSIEEIAKSPVYYGESLINGLDLLVSSFSEKQHSKESTKLAMLIVLESMAANDPTADDPGLGQIEQQAKEARELLGK